LFIVNNKFGASCLLYHNNRNGTFNRVLTGAIATDRGSENPAGGAWGDYDNDGFLDLFVATSHEGRNRLYHNNGDGTFTKITSGPMLAHPEQGNSITCAWGDYDNDGYLDLFVSNQNTSNQLFHNNGNGTFTQIISGPPVDDGGPGIFCSGPGWVDYDNDGFLDLLVLAENDDGTSFPYLYHNDGNTNSWLEVKTVGTVSNRSALGAKVRLRATIAGKTFWQTQEISAAIGYNTSPPVAHFGLGDAMNVEVLRIEWPSGIVQEIPGVASKQILTITEPARLFTTLTSGVPQFKLKGGRGLQYQIEASTNLNTWTVTTSVVITNLDGTIQIGDPVSSSRRFYRARGAAEER